MRGSQHQGMNRKKLDQMHHDGKRQIKMVSLAARLSVESQHKFMSQKEKCIIKF